MAQKDSGSIRILGKDNTENIALTKEDLGVVLDEVDFRMPDPAASGKYYEKYLPQLGPGCI